VISDEEADEIRRKWIGACFGRFTSGSCLLAFEVTVFGAPWGLICDLAAP
jgi:hypothetical protein